MNSKYQLLLRKNLHKLFGFDRLKEVKRSCHGHTRSHKVKQADEKLYEHAIGYQFITNRSFHAFSLMVSLENFYSLNKSCMFTDKYNVIFVEILGRVFCIGV